MTSWVGGLRAWLLWLVGDGPLPDVHARKVLGATVAVLVVSSVQIYITRPRAEASPVADPVTEGVTDAPSPVRSPTRH